MRIRVELTDDQGRTYTGEADLTVSKQKGAKPALRETQKGDAGLSLPDRILRLRDREFFATPKTSIEVHKEIEKEYYCEPNRVAVALARLLSRKELRKASKTQDGKKVDVYVW